MIGGFVFISGDPAAVYVYFQVAAAVRTRSRVRVFVRVQQYVRNFVPSVREKRECPAMNQIAYPIMIQ